MTRTTKKQLRMCSLTLIAAVGVLISMPHCDEEGDGDSKNGDGASGSKCKIVCDKSAECGAAPSDCMQRCEAAPPSDVCLACYENENCSEVGSCINSVCENEEASQAGNVSDADCTTICEKMTGACDDGSRRTLEDCLVECKTKTMVDDCLACPDIAAHSALCHS